MAESYPYTIPAGELPEQASAPEGSSSLVTRLRVSYNARIRKAVKVRGHFPTETAALKLCVPGHNESRPDRAGPTTLDEQVEARTECLYNRIPRPYNPINEVTEIHSQRAEPVTPFMRQSLSRRFIGRYPSRLRVLTYVMIVTTTRIEPIIAP